MCGSSPLADAVTRSTGIGALLSGSALCSASTRDLTASMSAGFNGPRFEPADANPLYGCGAVAEGRLQKYFGWEKLCPIKRDPIGFPSFSIKLPAALSAKAIFAAPVIRSG